MARKPLSQFGMSLLFAFGIGSGAVFAGTESTVPGNQADSHLQSDVKLETSGQANVSVNVDSNSSQTADTNSSHSSNISYGDGPINTESPGLSELSPSAFVAAKDGSAAMPASAPGTPEATTATVSTKLPLSNSAAASMYTSVNRYANSYQVGDSVFSAVQDDSLSIAAGYRSSAPVATTHSTQSPSPVTGLLMQVKLWLSAIPIPTQISETFSSFAAASTQIPIPSTRAAIILVVPVLLLVSLYTGRLRRSGYSRAPRSDMAATIPFATPDKWALTVRYAT